MLLVNIVFGLYTTSDDNRQFNKLLKQRSMENDNEYVWFTRDVSNNIDEEEMQRDQLRKQQVLSRSKIFKNIIRRKYPFIENTMDK